MNEKSYFPFSVGAGAEAGGVEVDAGGADVLIVAAFVASRFVLTNAPCGSTALGAGAGVPSLLDCTARSKLESLIRFCCALRIERESVRTKNTTVAYFVIFVS